MFHAGNIRAEGCFRTAVPIFAWSCTPSFSCFKGKMRKFRERAAAPGISVGIGAGPVRVLGVHSQNAFARQLYRFAAAVQKR